MEEDRGREQRWRKTGEGSRDGGRQGKGRDIEKEKQNSTDGSSTTGIGKEI